MSSNLALAVAAVLFGIACGGSKNVQDADLGPDLPDSVYIEVVNDHFYDARVHALYDGGVRHSLGTIPANGGHAEAALGFQPRALTFLISFVINDEDYVTHPIDAVRGEVLELRLPPNISASGFFRRVSR